MMNMTRRFVKASVKTGHTILYSPCMSGLTVAIAHRDADAGRQAGRRRDRQTDRQTGRQEGRAGQGREGQGREMDNLKT